MNCLLWAWIKELSRQILYSIYNKFMEITPIQSPLNQFQRSTEQKGMLESLKSLGQKKPVAPIIIGFLIAASVFSLVWFVFLKKSARQLLSPFTLDYGSLITSKNAVGNPLTGVLHDENDSAWVSYRPLGVMINNYIDARPQSGLIDADIVYEIVAEGGITRYLAFFLTETPEKIGPVRSTREYYLVLVKELGDAMIMHIGWSPQALEAIETWPVRSLARGGATFWRDQAKIDQGIAIEHTAYVNGRELRELGDTLGWEGTREITSWKFKDDATTSVSAEQCLVGECTPITIDFWFEGDYSAIFNFDRQKNAYLRSVGYDTEGNPIPHKDQETGEQLEVKNLLVQFVAEASIEGDDKNRLTYELIGSGSGLVFMDGQVKEVTWTKEERDERTIFYDTNGEEVLFNRGKFWVAIVPDRNVEQVKY